MTEKTVCMFCGKEHNKNIPKDCKIKSAGASSLWAVMNAAEAMYIMDRTNSLDELVRRINKDFTLKRKKHEK